MLLAPADISVLLDQAAACRRAADRCYVEAENARRATDACPDAGTGMLRAAADLAATAVHLDQASDHLACAARDPDLHAWLAHRAAGGVIILKQADRSGAVVVGDAQGHAPQAQPVQVLPWWKRRLARRTA